MLPLDRVLHRIKWDPEFGKGTFAIGYYDRDRSAEAIDRSAEASRYNERLG